MVKFRKRNISKNISKKKQYGGLQQQSQIVVLGNTGIILKPTNFKTHIQDKTGNEIKVYDAILEEMNINNMDTGKYVLSLGDIVGTKVMANMMPEEQSQSKTPKHKLNNLRHQSKRSTN